MAAVALPDEGNEILTPVPKRIQFVITPRPVVVMLLKSTVHLPLAKSYAVFTALLLATVSLLFDVTLSDMVGGGGNKFVTHKHLKVF